MPAETLAVSSSTISSPPDVESPLLDHYRALEAASRQMLAAARSERWEEVARLEQASKRLIAQLKEAARRHPMSGAERAERMRILHRIVVVDAEVRHLAQPWLADLDRMLGGRPSPAQRPESGMGAGF